MPDLCPCTGAAGDGDGFIQTVCQQIGVGVARIPLIGHAVDRAVGVAYQQACFQPHLGSGDLVGHQREQLDENRSARECPRACRRKGDLLIRSNGSAVIGHRHPAALDCAVRPQRHDRLICNYSIGRYHAGRIAEHACLREQQRQCAGQSGGHGLGHIQERRKDAAVCHAVRLVAACIDRDVDRSRSAA